MSEVQHGFFRHGDNAYLANFTEAEREVLVNLTEQIIELLAERVDHHNDDPLAAMVGQHMTHHQMMKFYCDCFQMHMQIK